ncbi:MAG: TIGR00730 family Rossman fold protein [Bacteroidia bacterium]|nr:TIGR00730 family Rossman fold protein [Bacteroidia bacterium]
MTAMINNISIFCGSATGNNSAYRDLTAHLGKLLAERNKKVIFGGGKVGLMGVLADSVLENGGEVVGVIPEFLVHKEIAHEKSQLIVVKTMQERKQKILEIADAFIALPGGFGTIDELFEMLTLLQLGRHSKSIGILNINNYFNNLILFLETMVKEQFLKEKYFKMIINTDDPVNLLNQMENFKPPVLEKWFR